MSGSRGSKSVRSRRVWILVTALIVAVACGESSNHDQGGPPGQGGQGGPPGQGGQGGPPGQGGQGGPPGQDGQGGPPGQGGQGGPPGQGGQGGPPGQGGQGGPPGQGGQGGPPGQGGQGGPPGQDGQGGPPGQDGQGGPPGQGGQGGPPGQGGQGGDPFGQHDNEHGPPFGENGDSGGMGMGMGGGSMMNQGPPPECTSEQTEAALQASSDYVKCTQLDYSTFMILVHSDVELLQGATTCFAEKVQGIEEEKKPDENGEVVVEVDEVFAECLEEVEAADSTKASEETANFLKNLIGPESKVCSCLPSFVENTPNCDMWARYRHFATHLEELCEAVDNVDTASMPGIVEIENMDENKAQREGEVEAIPTDHFPEQKKVMNPYGPCPAGQEVHPDDPTSCQEATTQGMYHDGQQNSGRGPPPDGEGGIMGLMMSVLGMVAIGGVLGVGAVWAWGKIRGGARQPGVRYMATGVDNDIGTELGPFGREYA